MGIRHLRKIQSPAVEPRTDQDVYQKFESLDGEHPWMKEMPQGYVSYRVRELGIGEVSYFNFALAKEMGLIAEDHPQQLTSALKEKLIKTFSIQIINEYDEIHTKKFDNSTIKPKKYMASRYLQLQHSDRRGISSGDGRGIWNGVINNRGRTWDVSSRGTGVTCLAPGAVEAKKPLKTGAGEFGYGCGLAEIDELYGAAILAEIIHLQGIPTERVLCIIDHGKGYGIGVRAAHNLLRPAHLFLYLKQNRYNELKTGVDYFIQRQIRNGKWTCKSRFPQKYDDLAEEISRSFAQFTAQLDIDYIFAWLDWDGDNVLMDAGIIDYGSVRQFGIRHDQYRYDDIERFSTNLNEQRQKARLIVQVFAQLADYLKTGKRRQLKEFSKHPAVAKFNEHFAKFRADRMLYRMGFNEIQRANILKENGLFAKFDREFSYFERAKISGSTQKVSDGINHPALFNLRPILRSLPEHILKNGVESMMSEDLFFKSILSVFAKQRDTKICSKHRSHIQNFQKLYKSVVQAAAGKQKVQKILPGIVERSRQLNRSDRITGNALIQIVFELVRHVKKGLPASDVQKLIDQLIYTHVGMPEVDKARFYSQAPRTIHRPDVFNQFMNLVHEYKDDI